MERLLVLMENFRQELAQEDPGHPHLPFIDANISRTEAEIARFNQSTPGLTSERVPTPQDLLQQAVQEYKTSPHTSELVDRTFQTLWGVWGARVGHSFNVPNCDRTAEALEALRAEGRGVLLEPDELYTREGLILLGRVFPNMQRWSDDEYATIVNEYDGGGCIAVEMTLAAPYRPKRGYTEQQLNHAIAADGRKGQRLATYIVLGQFLNEVTGHYPDEKTWSRLLGSSVEGSTLLARFYPNGGLRVYSALDPQDRSPGLGGRSEE